MGRTVSQEKGRTNGRHKQGREPNALKYNPLCAWCNQPFVAARPEARTCSTAHRSMLKRYVAKHGKKPKYAFGASNGHGAEVIKHTGA